MDESMCGGMDRTTDERMDRKVDESLYDREDRTTDGRMDGKVAERTEQQKEGWTERWMNHCVAERTERQTDGWTERWMDPLTGVMFDSIVITFMSTLPRSSVLNFSPSKDLVISLTWILRAGETNKQTNNRRYNVLGMSWFFRIKAGFR